MRVDAVESPEAIECPRCLWAWMTHGSDARRRLVVTLRAHVAVWHPDTELDALLAGVPSSRTARRPPGPPPAAIG